MLQDINYDELKSKALEKFKDESIQLRQRIKNSEDIDGLLEELFVYRMELQMQNDELTKTETNLRMLYETYLDLYNNSPTGYITLDSDFNITNANAKFLEMLKLVKAQVIGQSITKFVAPTSQDTFYLMLSNKEWDTNNMSFECEFINFLGSPIFFDVLINSEIKDDDKVIYKLSLSDITAQINTLLDKTTIESKLQSLLNNIQLGIYRTNIKGDILECNASFSKILEIPLTVDVKNLNIIQFYKNPELRNKLAECVKEKKDTQIIEMDFVTFNNKDIKARLITYPVFDEVNQLLFYDSVIEDLTNMTQMQDKLSDNDALLRGVFENIDDIMVICNEEGKIIFFNIAAELATGYKFEDVQGMYIWDYHSLHVSNTKSKEELREFIKANVEQIFAEGYSKILESSYEFKIKSKNGEPKSFLQNIFTIPTKKGFYIGTNARNITNIKKYQQQLVEEKENAQAANKLKSSIFANLSHEFRTPLNSILGFSEVIKESTADLEIQEAANLIKDSGERLYKTISMIIDLIELENNDISIFCEDFLLTDLIINVSQKYRKIAEAKNVKFEIHDMLVYSLIHSDQNLKTKLFEQLIDNAVKYTAEGSVIITLQNHPNADSLDFKVLIKDSGVGMDTSTLKLIFEGFRQGSEGLARKYEGLGIGLKTVQKLIEIMKIQMNIKSILNEGTEIELIIPYKYFDEIY